MSIDPCYRPPEVSAQDVDRVSELVAAIEASKTGSPEAAELIRRFNEETGCNYPERDFREYYGAVSLATFVKGALLPHPTRFPEVPDAQFVAIITWLCSSECDEAEQSYWLKFLEVNLECDEISDIIYWSNDDPGPEEILRRAKTRKRKVIVIPPTNPN